MEFDECSQSSQVFALTWVKRNVAMTVPKQTKISEEELQNLVEKKSKKNQKSKGAENDIKCKDSVENFDDLTEFDFENYDNETGNSELNGTSSFCMYASNYDDPYLSKSKFLKDDDDESDDLNLLETDNLLVCARCEKDYAQLDIYVYNDVTNDFYIHHDIPLSSAPLCLEWLDYGCSKLKTEKEVSSPGNFVAVGNLNSVIALWDLDVIGSLEPAFTLGVPKKQHKLMILEGKENFGHRDSVLDLSWTPHARNKLASASADRTVVIWDLKKSKICRKIKKHTAKVQALSWQKDSNNCILSGAFNGRVLTSDLRVSPSAHLEWILEDEIERVAWNQTHTNQFVASTNVGSVFCCDMRKPGKTLCRFKAHEDAVPAVAFNSNLLYSGSGDGYVKLWNIDNDSATLKQEKEMKMGMVHCFQLSPDTPDLIAIGGQKNGIKLWNPKTDKQRAPNELERDTGSDNKKTAFTNKEKRKLKRKKCSLKKSSLKNNYKSKKFAKEVKRKKS